MIFFSADIWIVRHIHIPILDAFRQIIWKKDKLVLERFVANYLSLRTSAHTGLAMTGNLESVRQTPILRFAEKSEQEHIFYSSRRDTTTVRCPRSAKGQWALCRQSVCSFLSGQRKKLPHIREAALCSKQEAPYTRLSARVSRTQTMAIHLVEEAST